MPSRITLNANGGPEVLRLEQVQAQQPGPGEVWLEQAAIGVNPLDLGQRSGAVPIPLPSGLGLEGAGVVAALGPGVSGLAPGDRVAYATGPLGAYASARLYPAERLLKLPDTLAFEDAAALLFKGITAHYLLYATYPVGPGTRILLYGAAGAVGQLMAAWARHLGAWVIGVVSKAESVERARAAGCDEVLVFDAASLAAQVAELTAGRKVDVVYDPIGRATFEASLNSLRPRGLLVSFGATSGVPPAVEVATLNAKGSLFLTRPSLAAHTANPEEYRLRAQAVLRAHADGVIQPRVWRRYPLAEAAVAHARKARWYSCPDPPARGACMQPFDSRQADEVATLLALAEHGSFAAAGRALQRHPSVLSKRLGALERRLGIRLVERTTRQLRFTDEGERLASRFRQAVDLLDEAEHEASLGAAQLRGRLRIALPSAMGRLWLGPLLAEFALAHPQVVLETDYSERFVDIIAEGFDLAIRVGELADSRLVARRLCAHRRILGAAPDYLKRHGVPRIPADLAAHNCLGFSGLHSYPEWKLTRQDEQQPVRVRGSMVSNDNEALLCAARQGLGIFAAGEWLMSRDLEAGRLVRVLPEWKLDADAGVYLVRPSARYATAAASAFRQWVEARFAAGPPWQRQRA
ncbi:LysR family transcriptional regulator [Pseudomonas aeruginosa]|nr:LysR family transcriptional regulator [Pseudomonas aeruginosa]